MHPSFRELLGLLEGVGTRSPKPSMPCPAPYLPGLPLGPASQRAWLLAPQAPPPRFQTPEPDAPPRSAPAGGGWQREGKGGSLAERSCSHGGRHLRGTSTPAHRAGAHPLLGGAHGDSVDCCPAKFVIGLQAWGRTGRCCMSRRQRWCARSAAVRATLASWRRAAPSGLSAYRCN